MCWPRGCGRVIFAGCSGASFGVLEPDDTLLEISVYAQDPLALLGFLLDG